MSDAAQVVDTTPQPKQAANVITSENLAEFTAKKLGLAPESAPAEAANEAEPVVEQQAESEPEGENEAATGEKKQNPKLEKRFSELTKQREAARQEAERERQARLELEERLQRLEQQNAPPEVRDPDPEPDPA